MSSRTTSDRVAVVNGASAGIGRASARAFAARGARVALVARGGRGLDAAAREVEDLGSIAEIYAVDVADADASGSDQRVGRRRILVGLRSLRRHRATRVQARHRGLLSRVMLPRNQRTIVQVGSAFAYRGIPLQSAYCGAKQAIQGFNEAARTELLHDGSGVHTTMVQMPGVDTPQLSWVLPRLPHQAQPVPPIYQPESPPGPWCRPPITPRRREYWVGGSTALTLAANAVMPGLLDRDLARTNIRAHTTARAVSQVAVMSVFDSCAVALRRRVRRR